jgi:hypothetical protein
MHSPHFTHLATNCGSGTAPGGRISFSEALLAVAEMRKRGTNVRPNTVEKIHLRLGKSTGFVPAVDAKSGKEIALVGHCAAQE